MSHGTGEKTTGKEMGTTVLPAIVEKEVRRLEAVPVSP